MKLALLIFMMTSGLSAQTIRSNTFSTILPQPLVVPVQSNKVFKVNFAWDFDTNLLSQLATFTLYMGSVPGQYNWSTNTGTNFSYQFRMTNWEDRMSRHWFVVTATDTNGVESLPSNEVHYPPFPPDHYRITWTSNWDSVTIYETTDPRMPQTNWNVTATVFSTNTYADWIDFTVPGKFFYLDKPDILTITAFNPNP